METVPRAAEIHGVEGYPRDQEKEVIDPIEMSYMGRELCILTVVAKEERNCYKKIN